ncbi:phosphotransferase [Patescibacteria group bacterium]|nr:phosphotransferase [Patescibacteria group bacterium]MBU3999605.1 phosphotransferase [Patescibacteria group bacterium]MBU4056346.1 phosphotransferase [Patescibacteria group bacterium]MBU4368960.1 phosphotransferase [Patescibacteria group bacterium]
MLIKQKFLFLALKKILCEFDIGQIKKIKPLATSGNITHVISANKKKYLLRLSPLGLRWRSENEILAELELIDHLLKNNFPVPKPAISKMGKRIVFYKKHFGYLREFIDGNPKLNPTAREIKKFGEIVGWFHNLIQNYKTKNKRKHIWDLEETKQTFKQYKGIILKSNFAQKEEFIKRFEKEIFLLNFPKNLSSGTIHEDLGKRHILWRKNKIIGIIDFDRSYYGKLILDLGEACRGWCFINNWKKWSNKNFQALISGYQNKRKLTKLEKKYLVDAIKFSIIERGLAFCLRFIQETKDPKDREYSLYSISKSGHLGMIEKNRKTIEKFLKMV